jgi:hypothetical protein
MPELRAEEVRLFAEVRAHRFADPTESNYWHRGRLKFPGRIEQTLRGLDRVQRGAVGSRGPKTSSTAAAIFSSHSPPRESSAIPTRM